MLLTEAAFERGLLPYERHAVELSSSFSEELKKLETKSAESAPLQRRLSALRRNSFQPSQKPLAREEKLWRGHLDVLVKPRNLKNSNVRDTGVIIESLLSHCSGDGAVYEGCFRNVTRTFIEERLSTSADCIARKALSSVIASLARWYLIKCVEISKYALHVEYKLSQLGYNAWLRQFNSFDSDKNPWIKICEKYPVLLRLLHQHHVNSAAAIDEFFKRFKSDHYFLERELGLDASARISKLHPGISDSHNLGRTVIKVLTSDDLNFVYKPKSIAIESLFADHLKNTDTQLGFSTYKIFDRGNYGWAEDVGDPQTQITKKYASEIGRAAAACWLLNAGDLHQENIRIRPDGIYLLDAETLLTASLNPGEPMQDPSWRQVSINSTLLFNSRIGIHRELMNDSGFDHAPTRDNVASGIHFDLKNDDVEIIATAPSPNQADQISKNHWEIDDISSILDAFDGDNLENIKSSLSKFIVTIPPSCRLRLIARDTSFYTRLLERIRQPRFLKDASYAYLDLMQLHLGVPGERHNTEALHCIVDCEIKQLLQGDIPFFEYSAGTTELVIEGVPFANFFDSSAIDHTFAKIGGIEDSDIQEQSTLVSIGLGTNASPIEIDCERSKPLSESQSNSVVMRSVLSSSFHPANNPGRWLALRGDVSGFDINAMVGDTSYFGGAFGILAGLESTALLELSIGDRDRLNSFLEHESISWQRRFASPDLPIESLFGRNLGFAGLGGRIFAEAILVHLNSERWAMLRGQKAEVLRAARRLLKHDISLDVISGAAGLVLGLVVMKKLQKEDEFDEQIEDLLIKSTNHLIENAQRSEMGYGWKIPGEKNALLGFAHGWAGIISALDEAARCLKHPGTRDTLKAFIAGAAMLPNRLLSKNGRWHDRRGGLFSGQTLNRSWCNGTVGLLRGLLVTETYWTEETRHNFYQCLSAVFEPQLSEEPDRFCCGEAGISDLMLDLGRMCNLDGMTRVAHERVAGALNRIASKRQMGIVSGHPELRFPSLYQGQSGLMYTLARCKSKQMPSLSGQMSISLSDQGKEAVASLFGRNAY